MITAIIIDDEKNGAEVLKLLLQQNCQNINIVAIEYSPEKGIDAIKSFNPDLVFLDIEMPTATGFDVINATKDLNYKVIFTTAYDHYAIKALKVQAMDYLLKPIDLDELVVAVSNFEKQFNNQKNSLPSHLEDALLNVVNKTKKISIPTNDGIVVTPANEITYIESDSNYCNVYLKDGRKICISKTLKSMEEQLKFSNFCRVHSAFLVNLDEVDRYIKGDGGNLILKNKTSIPVSRANKADLLIKIGLG